MPRRVVKGPQDSNQEVDPSKYSPPGTSRQRLQQSIDQSLNQMQADNLLEDIDSSKHESSLDQYNSIGDGGKIIQAKRQKSEKQVNEERGKPASRIDRQKQIQDLMGKYQAATKQSARRSGASGLGAVSIALSNPAAAAQYSKAYEKYNNAPVSAIQGGQDSAFKQTQVNKNISAQTQTDDQMDPKSNVSVLYRQQLKKNGIDVPQNSSAADIKKVFPFIQLDTKRDAQIRGQDITAQTKDQDRDSRDQNARAKRILDQAIAKNRNITAVQVAEIMARAGIDRVVIDATIKQGFKASSGGGRSATRDAAGLTFPNMSYQAGQNTYLVRDDNQGPPTQPQKTEMKDLSNQFARFSGALKRLDDFVEDFKSGRTDYNIETISALMSQYESAIGTGIKYFGNGVANGPDLVQMKKAIGDPDSLLAWISGGNSARIKNGLRAAQGDYIRKAQSNGYVPSKTPNKNSKMGPAGGTGSSASGNVFDPTKPANQALDRNGLSPLSKNVNNPDPGTPDIPQKIDKKTDDALKAMGF